MSNTFYVVCPWGKKANDRMYSDSRILFEKCNVSSVDYIRRIIYIDCNDKEYQINYVVRNKDYYDDEYKVNDAYQFLERIGK